MSEFSDAFSDAFDAASLVWGETCVIAGETYPCQIHGFEASETIKPGTAGRSQEAVGTVILKASDWAAAKALLTAQGKPTKGVRVTVAGDTFRVINSPDVGYDSDTVELRCGPLT